MGIFARYFIYYLFSFISIIIPIPWELNPVPATAEQVQATSQVVQLPVTMSLSLTMIAVGLSVFIGCLFGYMLGRRTGKIKPADILRQL